MFSINITGNSNNISPLLVDGAAKIEQPRALLQLLGEDLAKSLRAHFAMRNKEPNRHGWSKRHFWNREGRNNTALVSVSEREAVVSIASEAIAYKLSGGEVRPKRGRALAIPNSNEAYRAGQPSAKEDGGVGAQQFGKIATFRAIVAQIKKDHGTETNTCQAAQK